MTHSTTTSGDSRQQMLERFVWISIATAVLTLGIKAYAAWLTNSMALWTETLETLVNLSASLVAMWAIRLSAKPADHNHDFGHGKAEYVSAAVEGTLIFVTATLIIFGASRRLFAPEPLEQLGIGLALSLLATALNLGTGLLLLHVGKKHRSITLEADGHHLLTDVWTSVGVLLALVLIMLTDWIILDPLIAIVVGLNILRTGYQLVRRSIVGLLDAALPPEEVETVSKVINEVCADPRVEITELRTRESGRQRFIYATLTVPGSWTVKRSHDVADQVEDAVGDALDGATTFVHIEPSQE